MSSKRHKRRSTEVSSTDEDSSPKQRLTFGDHYQALLQTEYAVCDALLRRHRVTHGKAAYYQRLRMAFAALKRCNVTEVYPRLVRWCDSSERSKSSRKSFARRTEMWSLEKDHADNAEEKNLIQWATFTSNELLSRLESCVEPLVNELSRGFFVPFNITAFALVARFWTLVKALRSQMHQNLGIAAEFMHEDSNCNQRTDSTLVHSQISDRGQQILQSLGIPISLESLSKPGALNPSTFPKKEQSHLGDETSSNNVKTNEATDNILTEAGLSSEKTDKVVFDNDVGERVDGLYVDNETSVKEWQKLQKKKQKRPNAKKDVKSKDPNKKRRKQKAGDFFDDLFG